MFPYLSLKQWGFQMLTARRDSFVLAVFIAVALVTAAHTIDFSGGFPSNPPGLQANGSDFFSGAERSGSSEGSNLTRQTESPSSSRA